MASAASGTRSGSGVGAPSKPATSSTAATGSAAAAAATRSAFATAFEDVLSAADLMPVPTAAPAAGSPPDEIARRLQTLEDALCSMVWPAKADVARGEHKESTTGATAAFDPKVFVRPARKRPARSSAVMPSPPSQASASVAAATSTAAASVPSPAVVSLTTVAQRDREEAAIIAAIRSNNPAPLRALIAEVSTLRSVQSHSAVVAPHTPAATASPTHAHHSSMPSALTSIATDNDGATPAVAPPPKLNGLALLKAKAKAKALEAAQHHQQAAVIATQVHRDEEKASNGDAMIPPHRLSVIVHEDQHSSHIGRARDRNPSRSSAAPISAADHSRSPSGDRVVRPSRHGSFKRRRRRKKRLQNLEGGPYRSRFDEHGVLLAGYTSAASATSAASGQNTEDEESAPISAAVSPSKQKQSQSQSHSALQSPTAAISAEHAAVLAKASAHVSSLKKKARHSRAASMSDASDSERSTLQQAFDTPPKATTGPFSSASHQQSHARDAAPVFVTAPLLHSTHSSLPQLPHHLLKRNSQPHPQHSRAQQSHIPPSSHSQLVFPTSSSTRASLLRAPNFSSHPHLAALASQAGLSLQLDPDPMAPSPAVAARLAGLRVGVGVAGNSGSSIPRAGSSSWTSSSGMALPSQVRGGGGGGGGAASAAGQHAAAAAVARQFSPSRLQVQFDHSKHRSVPNSIEKPGAAQRAPVFAFHSGAQHALSPNYRVPTS